MTSVTSSSLFCGSCGGENPAEAIRCVHCSDILDPAVASSGPSTPPAPLDRRAVGVAGGVAAVLVLALHLLGLSFAMRVLPADASASETAAQIETWVADEILQPPDAVALASILGTEARLRAELRSGTLRDAEAAAIRERLPPPDQSLVLGLGGLFALLFPTFAFVVGASVAVAVVQTRRPREVALGLSAAAALQGMLWLISADFDLGAIAGGRLAMVGPGPLFEGAPALLLVMTTVASIAAASGVAFGLGRGLDLLAGKRECPHCEHEFVAKKGIDNCPACTRPLTRAADVALGGGGMTREATGATALLCATCAKTYDADACPVHPHEPLLDPRRDDVRFQLLELDTQAGTRRFTRWTDGLGIDPHRATPTRTGAGLCMACAKTYDAASCPRHPEEPLLDPSREDVRLELIEADDRQRRTVGTRLMFAAFFVALTLSMGVTATLDFDSSLGVYAFAGLVVGLMTVAQVLTPQLSPRRFGAWTGEGPANPDEFGMGVRGLILTPLRRSLAVAMARAKWMAAAVVGGAIVGGGVAALLAWSLVGMAALGALIGLVVFLVVASVVDTTQELTQSAREVAEAWKDPYA